MADGQVVPANDPFIVGGEKLMFPGDNTGSPWNVYNCRCAMRTVEKPGIEAEPRQIRVRDPITGKNVVVSDMTYSEWLDWKEQRERESQTLISGEKSGTIQIGKSLGAKAKNYPVKLLDSNQRTKLVEGQSIKGTVFAGKGTGTEIRDRFRLEADYHIPADKWEKVSGEGYIVLNGKNRKAELHWYEADGEVYEMKVKRYINED